MSEEFVAVNFKIGGHDALMRGLLTISEAVEKLTRNAARAETSLTQTTKAEAKKREAAFLTAEEAKLRATRRAVQETNRLLEQQARSEIKTYGDAVREHEKAEKEKTRATQREAAARSKAESQAVREAAAARRATLNERREYARNTLGGAWGGARGAMGTLASGAGLVTGAVGTAGVVGAVEQEAALRSALTSLSISTRNERVDPVTGAKTVEQLDPDAIRKQVQGLAGQTGIKATDYVAAVQAAANHGGGFKGADVFMKNLPFFSKLALSTDTKIEDIAENSATFTSAGIDDPEAQKRVMLRVSAAAKEGNVSPNEMGALLGRAAGAAQAGRFEGTAEERFVEASSLMQLARGNGATSPDDAATAVKNFYANISSKHGQEALEGLGVKTMVDKTTRRSAMAQYTDALAKVGGDPTKLAGILGLQAQPIEGALGNAWTSGGRGGIQEAMGQYANAKLTEAQVNEDAQRKQADVATQVTAELEKFKAKVGSELLPVLARNVDKFASLADGVGKLVGVVAEHPAAVAAGFVGLKAVLGAAEGALGTWLGKLLQPVPFTSIQAGVVNVTGGVGGGAGNLLGNAGDVAKKGAGGAGVLGWARGLLVANPIGVGVATGAAVGYGLTKLDDHMMASSPGYKTWMNEHGVKRGDPLVGKFGEHERDPLVARDAAGNLLGVDSGNRAQVSMLLGMGDGGAASGTRSITGSALEVPGLGANGAPVQLAPGAQVEMANADALADKIGASVAREIAGLGSRSVQRDASRGRAINEAWRGPHE